MTFLQKLEEELIELAHEADSSWHTRGVAGRLRALARKIATEVEKQKLGMPSEIATGEKQ